jgi:XTP/dITP diphosphohydrolase
MRTLLLGTRNPGKLIEITSILDGSGWSFSSLQEFDHVGSAEENGVTYAENAIAKAQFYATATGLIALADDSGLEVAALNWAPGVYSARYAGESASDADRRELLLSELSKTNNSDRCARFVAVVAIADPAGTVLNLSEGICDGTITFAARGTGGLVTIPSSYLMATPKLSPNSPKGSKTASATAPWPWSKPRNS